MTVEYFIQGQPQYAHEEQAILKLAQLIQRTFAASDKFYLLAANVRVWRAQADALVLAPNAITLIELKSCTDPIHSAMDTCGCWTRQSTGSMLFPLLTRPR